MIEGYQALSSATTNTDVIRSCEAKMRESIKSIGYFEESLREFEARLYLSRADTGRVEDISARMRSLPSPPAGSRNERNNARQSPSSQFTDGSSRDPRDHGQLHSVLPMRGKMVYTNLGESLE